MRGLPSVRGFGGRGGLRAVLLRLPMGLALVLAAAFWLLPPGTGEATPGMVTVGATATSAAFTVRSAEQGTADSTLEMAEKAWDSLAHRFARVPSEPIVIVVVEDRDEYERIQPAPMTRGFATFGGLHIYLLGDELDQEVVTHELVHILLGRNVRPGLWVPDWFNEGLAQWASGSRPRSLELMFSASAGDLLPLSTLDTVDALSGPHREMATLEGVAVVHFLADEYGDDAVWTLVSRLGSADSFDQALLDTFGYTDIELNDQWMAYAEDAYDLLSPAGLQVFGSLAFATLLLLAVIAWFIRRASRQAAMATEPPLTAREIAQAERIEPAPPSSHEGTPASWREGGPPS